MYYSKILGVWVLDQFDYFLISALAGSLTASYLKDYLSEKKAMERLKDSLIKKSKLRSKSKRTFFDSKKKRIKKIVRVALENRGGQFDLPVDPEKANKVVKLANYIKTYVELLATFLKQQELKQQELKGAAKIFYKSARVVLEFVLYTCRIKVYYVMLVKGLSTKMIAVTVAVGGATGFILSWFSVFAALVSPPVLMSTLLIRSFAAQLEERKEYQQYVKEYEEYLKFKKLMNQMLHDDPELLKELFLKIKAPTTAPSIEMKLPNFNSESSQTWEEFIKERMTEELGLIENPTQEQLDKMIYKKEIKTKPKGKTVYFRDFIDKIAEGPDNIPDAVIVDEPIRGDRKNQKL